MLSWMVAVQADDDIESRLKNLDELLEQMRLDSIAQAQADSIMMAEELERQLEQARLDSIRLAEEAGDESEVSKLLNKYHQLLKEK